MSLGIKCKRSATITDDADHAIRMASNKAEISGRRYGVFSAGKGRFRVARVTGNPGSALEIVSPSWSYDEAYRAGQAEEGVA